MKILLGKTFGIGNAVCAVPLLKALHTLYPDQSEDQIDVLIGSDPDDFGAVQILHTEWLRSIVGHNVYQNKAPPMVYDIAIMSIPYDGRWLNGRDYHALKVVDCRSRPDPQTTGFSSWERHEIEYQMENAWDLGYSGEIPSTQFRHDIGTIGDRIYLGLGYKRDQAGFWAQKHWGNEKYAELVKLLLAEYPGLEICSSGNMRDFVECMAPIAKMVNDKRFQICATTLTRSIDLASTCKMYVGNDTGMMHVAASLNRTVVSIFRMPGAFRKSRPWCDNFHVFEEHSGNDFSPQEIFKRIKEIRDEGSES